MSNQYSGSYNNPQMGGHRMQFNTQQQQQQQQMLSQLQMVGSGSGTAGIVVGNAGGGIMGMGYSQSNLVSQHQQQQQIICNIGGGGGTGNMSSGVVNTVNLPSQSHVQQQLLQQQHQQQIQMHQQQQSAHMALMTQSGMMSNAQMGSMLQQQHQQQQMQQNLGLQHAQQQMQNPSTSAAGIMLQQQQNPIQQQLQQQPHMQSTGVHGFPSGNQQSSNNMLSISQQPHKEINIVTLSRVGQETVQDITSRFQEIFGALKIIQPTSNRENNTVKKVQEHFRTIRLLFKRMRLIYERCNEAYPQSTDYKTHNTLIPLKETSDARMEISPCEEYRKALQENQELIDTVKLKNRQLREIIEKTRIIVWEINTMLSMRRS